MKAQRQIQYLLELPQDRLQIFLKKQEIPNLESLSSHIQKALSGTNPVSPDVREDYKTLLATVDACISGKKQENGVEEEVEFIDISKFKPISFEDISKVLDLTIREDVENKIITFLCMVSAYSRDAQFNISFNAPSSSGKSYIPTEIARMFPQDDVMEVGYCSPTAFFHDTSKEYDKKTNTIITDLAGKILIFLDQPHMLLLQHLRPLLSHDKDEIHLKITDKSQKSGLRTKNVILRGFPAVVFCTAGLSIDEQESTRFILLSPEISEKKIRLGIYEKINRSANSYMYNYRLETNPLRVDMKNRIRAVKSQKIQDIIIEDRELVQTKFFSQSKRLKPRHQRDMGRILSLIKIHALLNFMFRKQDGNTIYTNQQDIEAAYSIWDKISVAQELNLPPHVLEIFNKVIVKAYEEKVSMLQVAIGLTRKEIMQKHYEVTGRHISDYNLRKEILPMLETSGLILQEQDTYNKRLLLITPTPDSTISGYSGVDSGVNEKKEDIDDIDKQLGIGDTDD